MNEVYIGDGLYASFNGFHITIRTLRTDGEHWVDLEPAVFDALVEFHKLVWQQTDG